MRRAFRRRSVVAMALTLTGLASALPAHARPNQVSASPKQIALAPGRLAQLDGHVAELEAQIRALHDRVKTDQATIAAQDAVVVPLNAESLRYRLALDEVRFQLSDPQVRMLARETASDAALLDADRATDPAVRLTILGASMEGDHIEAILQEHASDADLRLSEALASSRDARWTLAADEATRSELVVQRHALIQRREALQALLVEPPLAPASSADPGIAPNPDGKTYGSWARAFLAAIDAPACADNQAVIVAWEASEGTAATWNPLATTKIVEGSTAFNGARVQSYPNLEAGLEATRRTLTEGATSWGYSEVLAGLRGCDPAMVTALAVRNSAWCSGCAFGRYVTGLVPTVQADFPAFARRRLG